MWREEKEDWMEQKKESDNINMVAQNMRQRRAPRRSRERRVPRRGWLMKLN